MTPTTEWEKYKETMNKILDDQLIAWFLDPKGLDS